MYITYHKEVETPKKGVSLIPYKALNKDIQVFIDDHKVYQEFYWFQLNDKGTYMFIYLKNGDNIDVQL